MTTAVPIFTTAKMDPNICMIKFAVEVMSILFLGHMLPCVLKCSERTTNLAVGLRSSELQHLF